MRIRNWGSLGKSEHDEECWRPKMSDHDKWLEDQITRGARFLEEHTGGESSMSHTDGTDWSCNCSYGSDLAYSLQYTDDPTCKGFFLNRLYVGSSHGFGHRLRDWLIDSQPDVATLFSKWLSRPAGLSAEDAAWGAL